MGTPVRVVSPDGQTGTLDSDELDSAVASGFRVETPEETKERELQQQYGDRPGAAAGLGALRGGSIGLSDAFLEGLGAKPEVLKGIKDANPTASAAGEIGGVLATSFIPGSPVSAVGRLGMAAERSAGAALGEGLLARVAAKGVGSAVEGGIYGAGQAVSDAALEGEGLKAEKLLAGVGLGGLLGFGGGAAAGLVGEGAQAGGRLLKEHLAPEGTKAALKDFAREQAMDAAGFIQSVRNKLTPAQQDQAGNVLMEMYKAGAIKPGDDVAQVMQAAKAWKSNAFDSLKDIISGVDDQVGGSGSSVRKQVAERRAAEAERLAADKADRQALKTAARDEIQADLDALTSARDVLREQLSASLTRMEKAGGKTSSKFADELTPLLDMTEKQRAKELDALATRLVRFGDDRIPTVETRYGKGVRSLLGEKESAQVRALDEMAEKAASVRAPTKPAPESSFTDGLGFDLRAATTKIKRELLPELDDPMFEGQMKLLRRRIAQYEEKAAKGVSFEDAVRFKANIDRTISKFKDTPISQDWKKRLRGILDDEIESQLQAVAGDDTLKAYQAAKLKYGALKDISKAAAKGIDRQLGNRSVSLTDYLTGMGGVAASLMTGNPLPLLGGAAAAIANKIARERGNSFAAGKITQWLHTGQADTVLAALNSGLDKLTTSAVSDAAQIGSRAATPAAVGSLLDGMGGRVKVADGSKAKDRKEGLQARMEQLGRLAADPVAMTESIQRSLGGLAQSNPQLANALSLTANRAVGYLQQQAPKPPVSNVLPALSRPWKPSDAELAKFERRYKAVTDPLSVFDDLRRGAITREAIEALQAVYPQLTTQLRTKMLERLADKTEPLPYSAQQALQAFLGSTQGNSAASVQMLQRVHQQADSAQPQQPRQGNVDMASGYQTEAQRIAGRRG